MTTPPPEVTSELVEDIPILMHVMREQLQLDQAMDAVLPRHGNRKGLSWGQMLVAWLTHILSPGDHHMYHVQAWADRCPHTLQTYLGQTVQPTDLIDDRLADGLWRLSQRAVRRSGPASVGSRLGQRRSPRLAAHRMAPIAQ